MDLLKIEPDTAFLPLFSQKTDISALFAVISHRKQTFRHFFAVIFTENRHLGTFLLLYSQKTDIWALFCCYILRKQTFRHFFAVIFSGNRHLGTFELKTITWNKDLKQSKLRKYKERRAFIILVVVLNIWISYSHFDFAATITNHM